MPKNLTDVQQWATVAVPVDSDTADAASVETPFQILGDRARYLLGLLSGMRVANWFDSDVSAISPGTFCSVANVMDICYDADEDRFWAIDDDGAVVCTIDPSLASPGASAGGGAMAWYDETNDPLDGALWAASGSSVGIASGNGFVVAVSNSNSGQIAMSSGYLGTWNAQTPSSSAAWRVATFDPASSLFIIAGNSGTPVHVSTSPNGASWVDKTTASGFSVVGEAPRAIASDPAGVGGTMILSDTEYSHTTYGSTFTSSTHGLGSIPLALAYSRDARWVAILTNGNVAYSDDDGSTWTTVSSPFAGFVATYVRLAADGVGALMASFCDANGSHFWASNDNGLTWGPVYQQGMIDAMESGACFGGGQFAAIGCLLGTPAAMHSLRMLDI